MTSIAEPSLQGRGPSWIRALLLLAALSAFALQTPMPWGGLWLVVPAAVAVSLLVSWRFGTWGVLIPVMLCAVALTLGRTLTAWVWWVPVAALTGAWMGLREEGGGPPSGTRAWMLLPVLLLAAGLPWAGHYADLIRRVERELRLGDQQLIELCRQIGYQGDRLGALQRSVEENATLRRQVLPHLLPTLLFVWVGVLVFAGRALSARAASVMRWPAPSRARLRDWRLPDGALWTFLAGLALLVAPWPAWMPTGWTLLLNAGLGYCVQGIAVVESLLLARGVPSSIIALTMLFVFAVAMPVFVVAAAAVGLSDAWLDFRRIEPSRDGGSSEET